MALSDGIYLHNANVNGGTAVWLKGASLTGSYKRLVRATPVPSNQTSNKYDIVQADKVGVENPLFTISGTIDIENTSSNEITQELLIDFWRDEAGTTRMTCVVGNSANTQYSIRDYTGDNPDDITNDTTDSNGIIVELKAFDIKLDTSAEQGHIINYTITLVESTS